MDRARTETVGLHLAIGEQAVFRVGTSDGFRRAWHRCWLPSGMIVAIGFLASIVDQFWHSVHGSIAEVVLNQVFWVLLATVGLCELLFLRRLMPWRPPGDVIALERMEEIHESRPEPLE